MSLVIKSYAISGQVRHVAEMSQCKVVVGPDQGLLVGNEKIRWAENRVFEFSPNKNKTSP